MIYACIKKEIYEVVVEQGRRTVTILVEETRAGEQFYCEGYYSQYHRGNVCAHDPEEAAEKFSKEIFEEEGWE